MPKPSDFEPREKKKASQESILISSALQSVKKATSNTNEQVSNAGKFIQEIVQALTGPKGERGEVGQPGPMPSEAEVVTSLLPYIPAPIPGRPGRDGLDGISPSIDEIVRQVIPIIPKPKDGKPGKDGVDGASDTGPQIVNKINDIEDGPKIDASHISGLPQYVKTITKSGGGSRAGATNMAMLTDTTITNPTNGQTLVFNATTGKWENGAGGGGGGGETLAQTLVLGNVTGGTDIIMSAGDSITSANGTSSSVVLNNSYLKLSTDNNVDDTPYLLMTPSLVQLNFTSGGALYSTIDINVSRMFIASPIIELASPVKISQVVNTGAGTSPLKFVLGGTLMTTPEAGAVEATNTHLYWTSSAGTRFQLDQQGGGGNLATTLGLGNTTSGNNIEITAGDVIKSPSATGSSILLNDTYTLISTDNGTLFTPFIQMTTTGTLIHQPGGAGNDGITLNNFHIIIEHSTAIDLIAPVILNQVVGTGAGTAPLKFVLGGTLMTAPEAGAVEATNTHLYWTSSAGTRYQLDQQGGGAGTLSATLALGNTTGGHNIVMSTGDFIKSPSGTGSAIKVEDSLLTLSSDGGVNTTPHIFLDAGAVSIYQAASRVIIMDGSHISINDPAQIQFVAPAYNFNSLTASQIAAFDGSSNLVSLAVATYPSLAELAFIKGLTSSAQTQLNARLPLAGGIMTGNILMTSNKLIGGSTTTSDLYLQTTTGVGAAGADMHFLVGNNGATEAMTILNSGVIGIGTNAPASLAGWTNVVVLDGATAPAYVLKMTAANTQEANIGLSAGMYIDVQGHATATNNNIIFRTEETNSAYYPTERMRIRYDGNVGIGSTNPLQKLYVDAGAVTTGIWLNGTNGPVITISNSYAVQLGLATGVGYYNLLSAAGDAVLLTTGGSLISAMENTTGDFKWTTWNGSGTTDTLKMILKQSGRLGINVAAPATILDVKSDDNIQITAATSAAANGFAMYNTSAEAGSLFIGGSTNATYAHLVGFYTGGSAGFAILNSIGTQTLRVIQTGQIGIGGVTAPTARLHLSAGSATASTAPLKFNSGALLSTPEAGAVEFLTDAFYGTITTGTARKTFAFLEAPTFSTSITGSYLTASQILITDGSKNIVSAAVATYPSLTELSYVKGVTSSIQTQIAALATSTPKNYRSQMYVMQASTTTITVAPGTVEINGASVAKTANTTLTLTTAGDWAGGSSQQAASTKGYVIIDASGNLKLTTTAPTHADYAVSITAANNTKRYATVSAVVYRYIGWFYMNATGSGQLDAFGVSNIADSAVRNIVEFETGAVATGTTTVPDDDTIPQNTEGDQYMSQVFVPTNVNNKLVITVIFIGGQSNAQDNIMCLFQDATANAIAVCPVGTVGGSHIQSATLIHRMKAATTSLITFKLRVGGSAAGTTTFNGYGGGRKYGGVCASSITVEEIESELT
jgi:hypothetical protein